jgi:hypothetical protein
LADNTCEWEEGKIDDASVVRTVKPGFFYFCVFYYRNNRLENIFVSCLFHLKSVVKNMYIHISEKILGGGAFCARPHPPMQPLSVN